MLLVLEPDGERVLRWLIFSNDHDEQVRVAALLDRVLDALEGAAA